MWIVDRVLTWWNGQTLTTQLWTWRHGTRVGEDALGNIYYQNKDGSRRWVIYNGVSEASKVPAEWHGWLHHTYAEPPTKDPFPHKPWEIPSVENMTGTPEAYRPAGSIMRVDPKPRSDYDAWSPQ